MMKATVQNVTPEMAYNYLTLNTKNYRPVDVRTVKRYAKEMAEGRWELNGEPITFSESGILMNGQHRLNAVVESGKTVRMLVVTGVKDDVVTYDDGKIRSAIDMAMNMGVHASTRMLSASSIIVASDFEATQRTRNTKRVMIEYASAHENEFNAALACVRSGSTNGMKLMDRAWVTATIYLLIRDGKSTAMLSDFCQVANSGLPINGRECSPALIIRNMYYGNPTLTRRSDEPENMHYLITAVNDFAAGLKRKKTYALQSIVVNRAKELWTNVRRLDGVE